MKTLLVMMGAYLFINPLTAQTGLEMPSEDAVWLVRKSTQNQQTGAVQYEYQSACAASDTLLNGVTYHQIRRCGAGNYLGVFREVNSIVYFVAKDSLNAHVAYDFNVNVGDSLSHIISLNGFTFYQSALPQFNFDTLVVAQIDTVNLNGLDRKKITFANSEAVWIEGVGNTRGLLMDNYINVQGYGLELICLSENQLSFYPTTQAFPCQWNVGLTEIPNRNYSIFPNPSSGQIQVITPYVNKEIHLNVFDSSGRSILSKIVFSSSFLLDLPNGVYFLQVRSEENHFIEKVVIQSF